MFTIEESMIYMRGSVASVSGERAHSFVATFKAGLPQTRLRNSPNVSASRPFDGLEVE